MIETESEYFEAMREMIRKVQQGYEPPFNADAEELEIFADCIREGYLLGETTCIDSWGNVQEHRTMDGKMHPILYNHVVTPKGLAFLNSSESSAGKDERTQKPDKDDAGCKRNKNKLLKIAGFTASVIGFVSAIITIIQFWPSISSFFAWFFM